MPELPEVETLARGLKKRILGDIIRNVEVRNQKSFNADKNVIKKFIIGASVIDVRRYQKMAIIDLSTDWSLVVHLKMTGQLVFQGKGGKEQVAGGHPEKAYEKPLPHKHTRVIFSLNNGNLYFNDIRKFGWIKLLLRTRKLKIKNEKLKILEEFLKSFKYSADPLTKDWKLEDFRQNLNSRKVLIYQAIMDQKVASGVGNIYANEALFCARVSPFRKSNTLTDKEIKKLYQCIKDVLEEGIKHGGTTFSDYRNATGAMGEMYKNLKVYDREGEKCFRCPGVVKRTKINGRSTHYCPSCQK